MMLLATCSEASLVYAFDADDGFGGVWILEGAHGASSNYIGSSTSNGDGDTNGDGDIDTPSGNAWGLHAPCCADVTPFFINMRHSLAGGALDIGQAVRIQMDSGDVSPTLLSGQAGFGLGGSQGGRFGFGYQPFVSSNYLISEGFSSQDTGIPFTDEALDITFILISADEYMLEVVSLESGQNYVFPNRTLGGASGDPILGISIGIAAAGDTPAADAFFNNLQISQIPEPSTALLLSAGGLCALGHLRKRFSSRKGSV